MATANLSSLLEGLHRLRQESYALTVPILITFLGVAVHTRGRSKSDVLSIQELSQRIGQPFTTTSTHLRILGASRRLGKSGLKLIEVHEYPLDRRQKYVEMTPRGERVLSQFLTLSRLSE